MAATRPSHIGWPVFRWIRFILELGGAFALFVAFVYVVGQHQYDAFAKTIVPILATYIATAALLYNRARGLPKNTNKVRSLYAAERAIQATIFTITGVLVGAVIYGWLSWFGVVIAKGNDLNDPWIFAYMLPLAFIEFGYASFLFALRAISKDFLRPISAREIARRIRNAP